MSDSSSHPDASMRPNEAHGQEGVDLIDVLVAMLAERRLAAVAFLITMVLCVGIIYVLKPQYVATASFLPQENGANESLATYFSSRGPGALYIGLLESRSVQDDMIDHDGLMQMFHATSREKTRDILTSKSKFEDGSDSLVTISVKDTDARDAASIANDYLDALQNLKERMALTQNSRTRIFFEKQLQQEKDDLATAEIQLEKTQKATGLIQPVTQTTLGLNAIASTRADITQLQVQLAALLQGATEQNPRVKALRSQIAQLQAQEHALEAGGESPAGAAPSAGQMPGSTLDYERAQREVAYHEALVSSLSKQFEAARLDESSARSAFQVVDRAAVPENKSWPPRKPFFLISLIFALLVAIAAVITKLTYLRLAQDPAHRDQIKALQAAFRWR